MTYVPRRAKAVDVLAAKLLRSAQTQHYTFVNMFMFTNLLICTLLQEAKAVYEKALEIDPNNAEARQGVQHCSQSLRNLKPEDR